MPSVYSAGSASVQIVPDFRNGQKAIQAWFAGQRDFHITVVPDMDNGRLAAMRALVGAQHAEMKVDVDHKHFSASMVKIVDALTGISEVGKVFSTLFGPQSILMTSGVGAMTAIAASASQAVGAVGLLPAGILALAAPIGVITIATHGMSDAFKIFAANTPAQLKAAQEALAKLAPAARDFVFQIHALAPAWNALRLDVQQRFFEGIGVAVTNLAHVALPILRTGLSDVATGMNAGIINLMGRLQTMGPQLTQTFTNIAASVGTFFHALAPIAGAFVNLAAVGSKFLPGIANGFNEAAVAVDNWISKGRASGQLEQIFRTALDTIKQLVDIVVNLGQVIFEVFRAAAGTGGTLLQIINELVGQLAAFLKLPIAQSALRSFFESIGAAVKVLAPALLSVVQALVTSVLPAIGGFVRALAPLVGSILVQFAKMLDQIAPLLYPALANAVVAILSALAPLIPIIGQIAVILLPIFTKVLQQIAPILAKVADLVGQALLAAIRVLAPLLPVLADAFIGILNALLPLVKPLLDLVVSLLPPLAILVRALIPTIVSLVNVFILLLPPIIELVRALLPVLVELIKALAPIFPALAKALVALVVALLPLLPPLMDLLRLILPPLTVILVGVVKLVGNQLVLALHVFAAALSFVVTVLRIVLDGIIGFVTHAHDNFFNFLHTVRDEWNKIWQAISDWAKRVWRDLAVFFATAFNAYVRFFTDIWNGILRRFTIVWQAISDWAKRVWRDIANFFSAAFSAYLRFFTDVWTRISRTFSLTWQGISDTAKRVWRDMSNFFSGAFSAFARFFSTVWSGISRTFLGVWQGMVDGVRRIWDGIRRIFAVPINFVINTILNNGLFAAWNFVVKALHLPLPNLHLNPIPGFRDGGPTGKGIYGRGGRNDPAGITHADEFVVKQGPAQKWAPLLYAINNDSVPGYAGGGMVASLGSGGGGSRTTWPALDSIRRRMFPGSVLTSAYRPGANDYHGLGEAIDIGWPGNSQAGLMPIAAALAQAYPNSTELIHNPNGSIKNGRPVPASFWGASTWAAHANHVHWAMTPEAMNGASGGASASAYTGRLGSALAGALSGFAGKFGHGGIMDLITAIPKALGSAMLGMIGNAVSSLLLGPSNDPTSINQTSSSMGLKNQAFSIAQMMYGWNTASARAGLDYIASHESGWNPHAQNSVSSASGTWQMIDSTWRAYRGIGDGSYAHAKDAPSGDQDAAAFRYIHGRFGTPEAAQAYWMAHHSYDTGGYLPPGFTTLYNGSGRREAVLTAQQDDTLQKIASGASGGAGGPVRALSVAGIHNEGTLTIQTVDVDEFVKKDRRAVDRAMVKSGVVIR